MADIVDLKEATLSNGVVVECERINASKFMFAGEEMKVEGIEYIEDDNKFYGQKQYTTNAIKFNGYYYAFKPKK